MAADNIYAIATATAKKAGYSNFDEGSEGEKKREEIVLALKRRGMKKSDDTREAAKYQTRGERKKSIMEQRKPATPTPKDPNRVKQGKWEGGSWISNAVQEIWKATYGANNDQARKTGQRTSVERKPRLNPRKLGVSDILKAKLPTQPPLRKPKIVEEGMEEDLYATGTVHGVEGLKRKDQVKKSLLYMLLNKSEEKADDSSIRQRLRIGGDNTTHGGMEDGLDWTGVDLARLQEVNDRKKKQDADRQGMDANAKAKEGEQWKRSGGSAKTGAKWTGGNKRGSKQKGDQKRW